MEEVETLGLHEDIVLLDVVETDDASHHRNIPLREELPRHLDELEHDWTAAVLLAPDLHVGQQPLDSAVLQTPGVPHLQTRGDTGVAWPEIESVSAKCRGEMRTHRQRGKLPD